MVGFDEERLIDPRVVQVMSGCCQQAQEDITGSKGLGKLQSGYTDTHTKCKIIQRAFVKSYKFNFLQFSCSHIPWAPSGNSAWPGSRQQHGPSYGTGYDCDNPPEPELRGAETHRNMNSGKDLHCVTSLYKQRVT